ncbi:hypothetical protein [Pseudomonas sp. Gutcm_11s]|uniref:hypothetical protein n=1 Tax=Pseudomonas sp. Gutcm_11s TaxID=3026088 RepID=UPI00235F34D8|nr:hypothetical protein [Pseudomonas sp. Gutcm_11s]MDD0843934.1 hypothetical protein [Pseudomonas sp. Gutcm_11s]
MRRTVLPYLLCLFCLPVHADSQALRQLHELDSHSRLLCASAMLYFDPRERDPDPRLLTAVFHHLNTLETDALQLGQPAELMQPLLVMQDLFRELDGLPRSQRQRYPQLVVRLLEQRRQLGEAVAREVGRMGAPAQAFGEQSRDLAGLLLDHQLHHYPLPQREGWLLADEQRMALEGDIERRFDRLLAEQPAQAAALGKIRGSYRFVQRQLRQGSAEGGGAEFYLSRAVLDLDELALAAEQGAR